MDRRARPGPPGEPIPARMLRSILAFARRHRLTRRETEVLEEVCAGVKNSTIATRMDLSAATVRLHLRNVYRKTATADKPELILAVWRHSLQSGKPADARQGSARTDLSE